MNYFFYTFDLIVLIAAGLFILSSLGSIFYFIFFFSLTGRRKNKGGKGKKSLPPVSVVICAKNEAGNLSDNLPLILEQDYPEFEVVVVDDCSEDNTQEILREFSLKYQNLKFTTIKKDAKFQHSKKLAVTIGIKAASHEILLHTDADCNPVSNKWIRNIAENYKKGIEIVLGYGGYTTSPGLLNKLIRYEAVFTAMQYMGLAEKRIPYMGVGRNLSYRKSLFFRNKGFASHTGLISGDDDLFISETANSENTCVETSPDSFTVSKPEDKFSDWFRQRKRHFVTGSRYKLKIKFLLLTEYSFRIIQLFSLILLLFYSPLLIYTLSLYLITLITKGIIYKIVLNRLNEKFLFIFSLIIEPFIPFIYSFIHFSNFIERKRSRWN